MIFSSSLVTPCMPDGGSPPRCTAISSTSSMNTTACSSSATRMKVSRSAPASPAGSAASRDGNTSMNDHSSREAMARAKVVFPVPGGPNSTTALGGTTPYRSAISARDRGRTRRRSSSSFSRCMPPIDSHSPRGSTRPPSAVRVSSSFRCTGMRRS